MPRLLIQPAAALLAVAFAAPPPLWAAQVGAAPTQSLRPYWHVFIAYAIAIVLVLLWVVSISRRLRDVEERLQQRP